MSFSSSWLLLLREKKNAKERTSNSALHTQGKYIICSPLSAPGKQNCQFPIPQLAITHARRESRQRKQEDVPGIQKKLKSCLSVNPGRFRCQSVRTSPVLPLRMIRCFQRAGEEVQWVKCLLYNREGCKIGSQHPSCVLGCL